jgi:hypothetical protein
VDIPIIPLGLADDCVGKAKGVWLVGLEKPGWCLVEKLKVVHYVWQIIKKLVIGSSYASMCERTACEKPRTRISNPDIPQVKR